MLGWFSERAACYLATGKPVITQSTGFENVLPTGTGLFAFRDMDEIGGAIETIESDYGAACRSARAVSIASRVVPQPAAPVSVTSLLVASN